MPHPTTAVKYIIGAYTATRPHSPGRPKFQHSPYRQKISCSRIYQQPHLNPNIDFLTHINPRESIKYRCGQWWKTSGKICGKLLDLPAFAHLGKRSDDLIAKLILAILGRALCQAKSLFIIRLFKGHHNFLGIFLSYILYY